MERMASAGPAAGDRLGEPRPAVAPQQLVQERAMSETARAAGIQSQEGVVGGQGRGGHGGGHARTAEHERTCHGAGRPEEGGHAPGHHSGRGQGVGERQRQNQGLRSATVTAPARPRARPQTATTSGWRRHAAPRRRSEAAAAPAWARVRRRGRGGLRGLTWSSATAGILRITRRRRAAAPRARTPPAPRVRGSRAARRAGSSRTPGAGRAAAGVSRATRRRRPAPASVSPSTPAAARARPVADGDGGACVLRRHTCVLPTSSCPDVGLTVCVRPICTPTRLSCLRWPDCCC